MTVKSIKPSKSQKLKSMTNTATPSTKVKNIKNRSSPCRRMSLKPKRRGSYLPKPVCQSQVARMIQLEVLLAKKKHWTLSCLRELVSLYSVTPFSLLTSSKLLSTTMGYTTPSKITLLKSFKFSLLHLHFLVTVRNLRRKFHHRKKMGVHKNLMVTFILLVK